MAFAATRGCRHIGIVIAGHEAHLLRRAETFEPAAGALEFERQRDIDEVAGDRDVVRPGVGAAQVGDDRIECFGAMDGMAVAPSIGATEEPLRGEFGER